MKKILHVVNVYFVLPYFLGDQLLYFKKKGYKEFIACSYSDEIDSYSKLKGFNYLETNISRSISPIQDIKSIYKIFKYIKKNNIDIVVGHTPKGGMIAMISSFIARVPQRYYFRHGLVYETSKGLKRFILKSVDKLSSFLATKVIVVSPSVAKKSIEDNLNSNNKQIILGRGTCNGIDTNRYDINNTSNILVEQLKSTLNIRDCFVIGFVGRLVNDKGIAILVKAFETFNHINPSSKLLLVGMLEERDKLDQEIIDIINTNNNIVITGYIPYEFIPNYYALMDVFVLPSKREGFPTCVLEASSMKLPIITTMATGCIDSISNQETGVFIDHNTESLIKAINFLYTNKDLRKKMGSKGRDYVKKYFSQEKIWKEIEMLYLGSH